MIESHPLVRKSIAHISSLNYPSPEIILIVELEQTYFDNLQKSLSESEKENQEGWLSEADNLLKKELSNLLKQHLSDTIILKYVNFILNKSTFLFF